MKFKFFLCLAALAPMVASLQGGLIDMASTLFNRQLAPQPPSIRVLLAHDEAKVLLEIKGKYHLFDPRNGAHIESNFRDKRRSVEATPDGIKWGEVFSGVYQIQVVPDSPDVATVIDGVEYRGIINIYDVGGSISIVNMIDLDDFLNAMLPQKYSQPMPNELLAAIAITARTDAYFQTKNGKNPFWDVDAAKIGYKGWNPANRSKPLEKAIRETRYMVLHPAGQGDWATSPLALAWRPADNKLERGKTYSKITIEQAEKLADKGSTAVQLLSQAFPDTSIQQIYDNKS
jgi:stage II sporulation protein D